jgi:hypothetical protein
MTSTPSVFTNGRRTAKYAAPVSFLTAGRAIEETESLCRQFRSTLDDV